MRREVIIRALETVRRDIVETGVLEITQAALEASRRREEKPPTAWFSVVKFIEYSNRCLSYGAAERQILEIFDLEKLSSPKFWEDLTTNLDMDQVFNVRSNARFVTDRLPLVVQLLRQDTPSTHPINKDHSADSIRSAEQLTIILPEEEGQPSSPDRIVYAISAISSLYTAVSLINGTSENDIVLAACDSGSDKSFDFLGLAKTMLQVKEIIVAIWDRRVFYRHMQLSASMGLISQSLPIIADLDGMAQNGSIEKEQAELLKRQIIAAASKFLESGAVTKELDNYSAPIARELMRPEQKLLSAPLASQEPKPDQPAKSSLSAPDSPGNLGDLTEEELTRLRALLGASGGADQPTPPPRKRSKPK